MLGVGIDGGGVEDPGGVGFMRKVGRLCADEDVISGRAWVVETEGGEVG